jgi:hypothetical protein
MYELIPILGGACVGWVAGGLAAGRARVALVVVLTICIGLAASVVSGELAESWLFALWDISQAAVAATLLGVSRARHRARKAGRRV